LIELLTRVRIGKCELKLERHERYRMQDDLRMWVERKGTEKEMKRRKRKVSVGGTD